MKALVIMNHSLNEDQRKDLQDNWGISQIWEISENAKSVWKAIPPKYNKNELTKYLQPVIDEIEGFDYIIIAGELTACTIITDAAKHQNIKILITTSKRKSIESTAPNGTVIKQSISKHIKFKEL